MLIAGGYFALFLIAFLEGDSQTVLCPTKIISGVPCPGCGMGRATIELINGHVIESLHYHLLAIPFTILMIFSLVWMLADLIKGRDTFFKTINKRLKPWQLILILGIITAAWVINLIRGI